ncbi:MAG TPA: tRNA pseudouridine(38-40) synthase TruA [Phnomibacter sp.]|nr:tRNA pseudouridine(38-40) synthase TruA [Phnomibacter sp.]
MRYFVELAYRGTGLAGFQIQENATTVQGLLQTAMATLWRRPVELTGSSRTDAGVHALQNYFHFEVPDDFTLHHRQVYNLNALLPPDIAVKRIFEVPPSLHCRFSAVHRRYHYYITQHRNPFLTDRAWYYPYALDMEAMQRAADLLLTVQDFTSFSKRNTQAHTRLCTLTRSAWLQQDNQIVYQVQANRFLRGMVRGLVGTMLQVGRGKLSLLQFEAVIAAKDCTLANFTTPAHGLFLAEVGFNPAV